MLARRKYKRLAEHTNSQAGAMARVLAMAIRQMLARRKRKRLAEHTNSQAAAMARVLGIAIERCTVRVELCSVF